MRTARDPCVRRFLPLLSLVFGCTGDAARGEVGIYGPPVGTRDDGGRWQNDGGDSWSDAQGSGGTCGASADVKAVRKPTTVWLIVETNSSLATQNIPAYGPGITTWTVLREILVGSQGLVPAFESVVKFGVIFHTGTTERACPSLRVLEPALNNGAAIDSLYPVDVREFWNGSGGAITYKALETVGQYLTTSDDPPGMGAPTAVIIAKSSSESLCLADSSNDPGRPNEMVREALVRLVAQDVTAFVLRLPSEWDTVPVFEDELARIGGTGKAYTPLNTAQIQLDFEKILRDSVSCEVALNGEVMDGSECEGTVEVDGVAIPCGNDDGWRLKDPRTLEFVGSACTNLRSRPTAQIKADFPCGVIVF